MLLPAYRTRGIFPFVRIFRKNSASSRRLSIAGVRLMLILIVEDDSKLAQVLRVALEKHGHRTTHAANGLDGYEIARNRRFESIILDAMLPEMDGYTVARSLRRARIATPILMLTARDTTSGIVHGLDSGVDDYLTKPFSFE